MKKIVSLFLLIVVLFISGLFIMENVHHSHDPETNYYFIGNNENDFYDKSQDGCPIPTRVGSIPFHSLHSYDKRIVSILPYIPLHVGYNTEDAPASFQVSSDLKHWERSIPYNASNNLYLGEVDILSYPDKSEFLDQRYILKKFDNQSGIYISEYLLELLEINDIGSHLTIETTILVPNQASISSQVFSSDTYSSGPIDYYAPSTFTTVPVSLEIEGIIKKSDLVQTDIIVPYYFSENLYQNHPPSKENAWQPQLYVLEVDGDLTMDQLGSILLEELPSFKLFELTNGIYSSGDLKVYRK